MDNDTQTLQEFIDDKDKWRESIIISTEALKLLLSDEDIAKIEDGE